jgi:predicted DNA-binding transcriptional regulator AlpA
MLDNSALVSQQERLDRYVTDAEAANILGLSQSYLRNLRVKGGGPKFGTFGRAVRYRAGDLFEWAASKSATSTSGREVA